jgi:DeoR/GlpR family transcriptional regulator of sugar metabolism
VLLQILNFIRREGVVSTQQLCREFRVEQMALQPMLDVWSNKGFIAQCAAPSVSCKGSSCGKCSPSTRYYQYSA